MPRRLLLASALCLAGISADASAQEISAQTFAPAIGPSAAFSTEGSGTLEKGRPTGGLFLNYSSRPIVVVEDDPNSDDPDDQIVTPVVDQQLAAHIVAGIGITDWVQLGIDLPVYILSEGDLPEPYNDPGIGDLRFSAKARIFGPGFYERGFGLGLAVDVTAPTGTPDDLFIAASGPTAQPRLLIDGRTDFLWVGVNTGVLFQATEPFGANASVGNSLTFGLGAEVEIMRGMLLATGDIYGRTLLDDFGGQVSTPVDAMLGGKLITTHGVAITGAAGGGVVAGLGAPEFRMLFGVGWAPRQTDFDGDNVTNRDDRCPEDPEDLDGYEDQDGCPELDNDGDAIADTEDDCPMSPEDLDGFQDEDGCPDADNDNDGIYDDADQCRDEAEDRDGFQDEDGCPELDNDEDGIEDSDDKCPLEAEDPDGFEDDDGCPEPDNDGDRIPDTEDACPNEPGMVDERGCPPAETKAVLKDTSIEILDVVYFETKSEVILGDSYDLLNQVAWILEMNPTIRKVEIGGHTDSRGSAKANLELSQKRADSVMKYLTARGIAAERLTAVGYGEDKPIEQGNSKEALAKNRRVEFNIVEQGAVPDEAPTGPQTEPEATDAEAEPATTEPPTAPAESEE